MTRKPLPAGEFTFRLYWPEGLSAEFIARCDLVPVSSLLTIDRHPVTNQLRVRFPEPFDELQLVAGERLTTPKAHRLFAAVEWLASPFSPPTSTLVAAEPSSDSMTSASSREATATGRNR